MRRSEGVGNSEAGCRPIMMIGLPTQEATGLAGSKAPIFLFYYVFIALFGFAFLVVTLSIGARNRPVCEFSNWAISSGVPVAMI